LFGVSEEVKVVDELSPTEIATLFSLLADQISQIQDPDLTLELILQAGLRLTGAPCGAGMLVSDIWQSWRPEKQVLIELPEEAVPALSEAFQRLTISSSDTPAVEAELIEDMEREDYPEFAGLKEIGFSACMVIPLSQRGVLLGAIYLVFEDPPHLSSHQITWASVLSRQASIAMENARLIGLMLRQASELGTFYETATSAGDDKTFQELLDKVIVRTTSLFGCPIGVVYLADAKREKLEHSAHFGVTIPNPHGPIAYGEELAGQVAATLEPAVSNDCEQWLFANGGKGNEENPVHVLSVPLVWQDSLIGVLELVADPNQRAAFSETDIEYSRELAFQAANVIGVAQLLKSERQQRRMAEALGEASLAISGEVDLIVVLDRILEQVMHAFPCDAANFQIISGERTNILRHRGYEQFGLTPDAIEKLPLMVADHLTLQRMMKGETVLIADTQNDPAWVTLPGLEWLRSWVGAPIQYGQSILGFIHLDSSTPHTFDEESKRWLTAFAAHVAAALYRADLFSKLAEEHGRLRTLNEIEGQVTAARLEPDHIYMGFLTGVLGAIDGFFGQVYLPSDDPDEPVNKGVFLGEMPSGVDTDWQPLVESLAVQTIRDMCPAQVGLNDMNEQFTLIGIPIFTGDYVWAAALVWVDSEQPLEEAWLNVFHTAGQHTALALSNAEKHIVVQRRLAEMTVLQRIIGAIVCRLDTGALLWEVTEQLHTSLGFPAVQIYRLVGKDLILVASSGPQPLVDKLQASRGIIGRVVRTGAPALIDDVSQDPDYVATLVGTRSKIAVPFYLEDEIVGVINVETSDPSQADDGALELLILLADQVSVALQNAVLYERVQESVGQLEEQIQWRTSELEKALEDAQAADRAKALFIGDVSHELRTPLTNIGLYLDLLEMGTEDRRREYMITLRRETGRLAALIEQLLAISHLDSEQAPINRRPTEINPLIQVLAIDRARLVNERGLGLEIIAGDELPLAQIDPQFIVQAMANLLTNSMNYTPMGGKITISTNCREWKKNKWVTICVKDTGPGIAEGEKKRVFDRFFRGLVGRASGIPGTGLGLAISKEIIERHGGRIQVGNTQEGGASFTIWLPVVE
jgi:signal transduction histidine kinase